MRNQTRVRHRFSPIPVLFSLISTFTLVVMPARSGLAQTVAPNWSFTGNLNFARSGHTATLLQNGQVLVAGGRVPGTVFDNFGILKSAELFDPATGTWSVTGNLNTDREGHTATLLPNGKVLVAGGFGNCLINAGCRYLNSAELFDPATGTWSTTGNLNTTRVGYTATLLPNGKVLVAAGQMPFNIGILNTAELYDPATGTWSNTGNLNTARNGHSATLLPNGKVLVAGFGFSGNEQSSAELYDPTTETWSITGSLNTDGGGVTAELLPNGKVLVAGNNLFCENDCNDPINAELYDPTTQSWSDTDKPGIFSHTATLLASGKVLLIMDQYSNFGGGGGVALYDPATGIWSETAHLNEADRFDPTATLLANGKVLVAGGWGKCIFNVGCSSLNTTELYDPGTSTNQIDDASFFIRQQYLDFLGREPESEGLQFYLDILNGCQPSDTECLKYTRGALSANFFRSPEFQRKGNYVMFLYMVSLGQRPLTPSELATKNDPNLNDRPHYSEFLADLQSISTPNDDPALTETKKAALADAWMQRAEIQALYPAAPTMTNAQFVQELLDTAGVTNSNQSQLVTDLDNQSRTRAQVLRAVAESPEVSAKFYQQAFVTMEYFGYLRRDPEDCHNSANWTGNDPNQCGFIFHNNRFNLGFDPAQVENVIVRGFIESPEYRHRFGP